MKKPISSKNKKRLKSIGERVKELRLKDGYTNRSYFAFEKKLNLNTVARVETGQDTSLSSLLLITDALNISLEELFKGIQ